MDDRKPFSKEDFTEEELIILKAVFDGGEAMLETMNRMFYVNRDALFYVKEKLGIYDLLESI